MYAGTATQKNHGGRVPAVTADAPRIASLTSSTTPAPKYVTQSGRHEERRSQQQRAWDGPAAQDRHPSGEDPTPAMDKRQGKDGARRDGADQEHHWAEPRRNIRSRARRHGVDIEADDDLGADPDEAGDDGDVCGGDRPARRMGRGCALGMRGAAGVCARTMPTPRAGATLDAPCEHGARAE
jgi:hypothetical protein